SHVDDSMSLHRASAIMKWSVKRDLRRSSRLSDGHSNSDVRLVKRTRRSALGPKGGLGWLNPRTFDWAPQSVSKPLPRLKQLHHRGFEHALIQSQTREDRGQLGFKAG